MYKKQVANFWVAEKIDLSNDKKHWITLTPNERNFINLVLALTAIRLVLIHTLYVLDIIYECVVLLVAMERFGKSYQ